MRAFLGRTAFYWLPFLITSSGFSLLGLWFANLPSGENYLLGPPEFWQWLGFTLLIGLPGMGTACAIVGARTGQVGWAGVAGLAGLVVSCLVAALRGGTSVFEALTILAPIVSVPFLVGFGAGWAGWAVSRPSVPSAEPVSAAASRPSWRVVRGPLVPGIPAGGTVDVAIERGELVLTKPGVGRMAGFPVAEVRLVDLPDGTWRLTQRGHEVAVLLAPIGVDPAALAAALANQTDATS